MSLLEHIEDGVVTEEEVIAALTADNADNIPWNADNANWLRENFKAVWDLEFQGRLGTGETEGKPSWMAPVPYLRGARRR